jgi:hypothetical protein
MTVIPATWKAKVRRIVSPDKEKEKVGETPFQQTKLGMVACNHHPSYSGKCKRES